ncbi:MAG: PxKF domain-containing protein [Gaiellaceae bacterium]
MATPDQIRRRGRWSLVLGTLIAALMVAAVAWADPIANNIDTTVDPALESVAITAGGSVSVGFYDISSNTDPAGDGGNGCNSTGSAPSTVTLSVPANVTVNSSSFSLVGCGVTHASSVSFTSSVPGSYTISIASVTGGKSGSLWNTAPASFTLTVNSAPATDTTPPVITPDVSGTLGDNGWYVSDVTVSWNVVDDESAISSSSGCGPTTINADTTGTTLTCTATSAGGTASDSVTIKRDATAPTVVLDPSADSCSVPGNNGWCRGEQTAGFTASDATSGLDPDGAASRDSTKSTTTNGAAVLIASGAVSDLAGNSNAGIDAGPFKIDSVAPAVTCQSPAPAFILNQPGAQVSASVTDATSQPVSATELGNADTTSPGPKTVGITGEDNAGNSASANCAYTVGFNFAGLFAPIDRPNAMNVSKAGQAIPLKWRLTDYFGDPVTSLTSVTVTVASIACSYGSGTPDELEEYASGSSGLQNQGDGYYQFNWKTPTSYAGSCKQVNLNLGEGTVRTNLALISFKK